MGRSILALSTVLAVANCDLTKSMELGYNDDSSIPVWMLIIIIIAFIIYVIFHLYTIIRLFVEEAIRFVKYTKQYKSLVIEAEKNEINVKEFFNPKKKKAEEEDEEEEEAESPAKA